MTPMLLTQVVSRADTPPRCRRDRNFEAFQAYGIGCLQLQLAAPLRGDGQKIVATINISYADTAKSSRRSRREREVLA